MMKKLFILTACIFTLNYVSAQTGWENTSLKDFGFYNHYMVKYNQLLRHSTDDRKYQWNNPDKAWTNIFLPWGNVGIGTITPTSKLHIVGNVKIEGTLNSFRINVDTLEVGDLTVQRDIYANRNIFIKGLVGIGVTNPTQKLDINGNIKVSNSIYVDSLFAKYIDVNRGNFSYLKIVNDLNVNGKVGIGVASPVEKFEVAGNIKATHNLIGYEILADSATLNRGLKVRNIESSSISTENIISKNLKSESGYLTNLRISNNVNVDGKIGLGVETPDEKLEVAGNIKSTQKLMSHELKTDTATITKGLKVGNVVSSYLLTDSIKADILRIQTGQIFNLTVPNNLNVNGKIGLGIVVPNEKLEVSGNIKTTQKLISAQLLADSANLSKKLSVDGPIKSKSVFADSVISGKLTIQTGQFSNLNISNNLNVNGKIGLGVNSPIEKFEVDGSIKSNRKIISAQLIADSAYISKKLIVDGPINSKSVFADSVISGKLTIETGQFTNLNLSNNLNVNGKISLGVTTPIEKFEVAGSIKATQKLISSELFADTASFTKGIKVANILSNSSVTSNSVITNSIKSLGTQNLLIENDVVFQTNAFVNQTLAIGVDKVPSGYHLAVKGKIIAEEIKVRNFNTWPDYVFSNNYKLKSLGEVEMYIKQHKHLEGIPSAAQAESEGIEVGNMQTKLLEKIEELTLYLIDLKKQNDMLSNKVEELEKKIKNSK